MKILETVNGTRFLAEEIHKILHCDICNSKRQEKTATMFCQGCDCVLCQLCATRHNKSPYHLTLPIERISGHSYYAAHSAKVSFSALCDSCQNGNVSNYCEQHEAVTCKVCKTVKHNKCSSVSLEEICRPHKSVPHPVYNKISTMHDKLDQLHRQRTDDLHKLSSLKETCINESKTYITKVRKLLELLEEKILTEVNKCTSQEFQEIEHHRSVVSATKQLLQNEKNFLQDVRKLGTSKHMFAAEVKVSNRVKEYELLLHDLSLERKKPLSVFTKNEHLKILKTQTKYLETLLDDYTKGDKSTVALLTNIELQNTILVPVKRRDDINTPTITGCDCTHDGKVILCDFGNSKIKLLHESFLLNESLNLTCQPWNVSVIDRYSAVVTFPDSRKIEYIRLGPTLTFDRSKPAIQLDKECWGIKTAVDVIYITVTNDEAEAEIRVLDLQGRYIRKIVGMNFMLQKPFYLTVDTTSGRLFCSDSHTNTVTCLKADGSLVYQYSGIKLKSPGGMWVDATGGLIICSKDSDRLQVITQSGKKAPWQPSADIKHPVSLAFRPIDHILIIGCSESTNLGVLHLTR